MVVHSASAQPVFIVGTGEFLARNRTPVREVCLESMAPVYPHDKG